jgi:hypothetical protein
MVACLLYVAKQLPCKLVPGKPRCGNCVYFNLKKECKPAEVPLPDFSKIDAEIERLKQEEEATKATLEAEEEVAESALRWMRDARSKLKRLSRQKKLLKRKEQKMLDYSLATANKLEQLERMEELN